MKLVAKRLALLVLCLCVCTGAIACAGQAGAQGGASVAQSTAESAAESEAQELAAPPEDGYTRNLGEEFPRITGSTACLPLMAEVYARVMGVDAATAEASVSAAKTDPSWRSLMAGGVELILSYEPSAEAKAYDEGLYTFDELEIAVIGYDALVFLVNADNPVQDVTADELRDIYTGRTTSWQQLGGAEVEIKAFQRNTGSGSQTLFLDLLMGEEQPMDPPMHRVEDMKGMIEQLASFDDSEGAIGYSVYYYVSQMYGNPNITAVAVDGTAPTPESIADGSYPLTTPFYVAIRPDAPADSAARELFKWMQSAEGREVVEAAGYVAAQGEAKE